MMTSILHILTGQAYLWGVGGLSAILAHRLWRDSKQGALVFIGLVWMALSCGPHHGHWGAHLLNNDASTLDAVTISVAFPFGVAWLWWQTAAVFSERSPLLQRQSGRWFRPALRRSLIWVADRWPTWWHTDWLLPAPSLLPPALLVAETAYIGVIVGSSTPDHWTSDVLLQAVLAGLYLVIAGLWWWGQFARRAADGAWSMKGVTLGLIWGTCAMSHWSWAVGVGDGIYKPDWHMLVIDGIGIPAAIGFIGLVLWLQRRSRTTV